MKLNLTNIEETKKFEPLEEGEYGIIISDLTLEKSKKNDDMLLFTYKILGIEEKRNIKDFVVLTNDISLGKLKTILRLSEVPVDQDVDITNLVTNGYLIGKKFKAFIGLEKYTNEFNKEVITNKLKYIIDENTI